MRNKKAKDSFLQKFATFAVDKRYILLQFMLLELFFYVFNELGAS